MAVPTAAIAIGSVSGALVGVGLFIMLCKICRYFLCRQESQDSPYARLVSEKKEADNLPQIIVDNGAAFTKPKTSLKPIPFTVPPSTPPIPRRGGEAYAPQARDEYSPSSSEQSSPMSIKKASVEIPGAYALGSIDPSLYKAIDEEDNTLYPEDHRGRIWFAVEYERESEKLRVTLMKARNLPSRVSGNNNGCDPFVRIYLMPDERRYMQSKSKRKTCNPNFEESYVFQVSYKTIQDRTLKLTVFDVDRSKRHRSVGHALYPLKEHDCESNEQVVIWRDLEREVTGSATNQGELHIALTYNDNLERLTVGIFEGKNLRLLDGCSSVDCYVKVSLLLQNKMVKTKKTEVLKRTDCPAFNESFSFKVSPSQEDTTSFSIHAMQHVLGHKDKVIGRVVLGPYMFARGKELEHWNTMIANKREQISMWHVLT
ncbi:synaptotagmin-15 isoform X2 [Lingula anatina]|uniref:Synaptotagmin-15 isoform X2 n=1 Tax=Lingula anatina TaxID=7574 RepID=A0A1S3INI9_LINAN|nr:synaptotagmin-15 isoform X2 [Lingula anatina]|eukprot:XP_013399810.1 synaptotagmin-15 isoform X2 [Lingula anatina]